MRALSPIAVAATLGAMVAAGCGRVPEHDAPSALHGTGCWSCHGDLYLGTVDPDHASAEFPHECGSCHTVEAWAPASFGDHDVWWPLEGAHASAPCASCHVDGQYAGTPRECSGCHQPDYDATTDPGHVVAGFPTTCDGCHSVLAWKPASYGDHDDWWALTGQHTTTPCSSCHADGIYQGTPRECEECHLPDYLATTSPDHEAAGYPHPCAGCHTTSGWSPASLSDHDEFWPLTGAHAATPCSSCHVDGVFAGTPTSCDGCHHADWQGSTNPNHPGLAISTTCDQCHGTAAWQPADFPQHDTFFPIKGRHGKYECEHCHLEPELGWSSFTCVDCHEGEHSLGEMNSEHQGRVSGYAATLAAYPEPSGGCYECHPKGTKR